MYYVFVISNLHALRRSRTYQLCLRTLGPEQRIIDQLIQEQDDCMLFILLHVHFVDM